MEGHHSVVSGVQGHLAYLRTAPVGLVSTLVKSVSVWGRGWTNVHQVCRRLLEETAHIRYMVTSMPSNSTMSGPPHIT